MDVGTTLMFKGSANVLVNLESQVVHVFTNELQS